MLHPSLPIHTVLWYGSLRLVLQEECGIAISKREEIMSQDLKLKVAFKFRVKENVPYLYGLCILDNFHLLSVDLKNKKTSSLGGKRR